MNAPSAVACDSDLRKILVVCRLMVYQIFVIKVFYKKKYSGELLEMMFDGRPRAIHSLVVISKTIYISECVGRIGIYS